jgi:hypothetical protein
MLLYQAKLLHHYTDLFEIQSSAPSRAGRTDKFHMTPSRSQGDKQHDHCSQQVKQLTLAFGAGAKAEAEATKARVAAAVNFIVNSCLSKCLFLSTDIRVL